MEPWRVPPPADNQSSFAHLCKAIQEAEASGEPFSKSWLVRDLPFVLNTEHTNEIFDNLAISESSMLHVAELNVMAGFQPAMANFLAFPPAAAASNRKFLRRQFNTRSLPALVLFLSQDRR